VVLVGEAGRLGNLLLLLKKIPFLRKMRGCLQFFYVKSGFF